MSLSITINAKARIFRLFDLAQLLNESDLDLSQRDLSQKEEIRRLYEVVTEFVETGEVGVYDDMLFHLHGFDPQTCEIIAKNGEEKELSVDEITLVNQPVRKLIDKVEHFEVGRVFLATLTSGDARWDFDSDIETDTINPQDLKLGYYDCSEEGDQYDVIGNVLFTYLCDTFSTDQIKYGPGMLELKDFVLHPEQTFGQLFVMREMLDTGEKVLERIDPEDMQLQDAGWQLLVNPSTNM